MIAPPHRVVKIGQVHTCKVLRTVLRISECSLLAITVFEITESYSEACPQLRSFSNLLKVTQLTSAGVKVQIQAHMNLKIVYFLMRPGRTNVDRLQDGRARGGMDEWNPAFCSSVTQYPPYGADIHLSLLWPQDSQWAPCKEGGGSQREGLRSAKGLAQPICRRKMGYSRRKKAASKLRGSMLSSMPNFPLPSPFPSWECQPPIKMRPRKLKAVERLS